MVRAQSGEHDLRDRNTLSVVLWNIGNEMTERAEPHRLEIGKALTAEAHRRDPTRKGHCDICYLRPPLADLATLEARDVVAFAVPLS